MNCFSQALGVYWEGWGEEGSCLLLDIFCIGCQSSSAFLVSFLMEEQVSQVFHPSTQESSELESLHVDLFVTFLIGFLSLIGSQRFPSLLVEGVDLVEKEECLQGVEEEEEGEDLRG